MVATMIKAAVKSDTVSEHTAGYKVGNVCFERRPTTAMCNLKVCERVYFQRALAEPKKTMERYLCI